MINIFKKSHPIDFLYEIFYVIFLHNVIILTMQNTLITCLPIKNSSGKAILEYKLEV